MPGPELICAVATKEVFDSIDKEHIDAFYLGNPYCSKIAGNLISEHADLTAVINDIKNLGKKAYFSTIGVPVGDEFDTCQRGAETASRSGADAIEVHDMGMLRWVRSNLPDLPVHIGFYANIYNVETAKFFKDYGAKRILPSHELTDEECRQLLQADVELETSVYGSIPLGYANTCILTLEFPSREPKECVQQCADGTHYVQYSDWSMRSAGNALVSGEDLCLIADIPDYLDYAGLRLETLYDKPYKINKVVSLYRQSIESAIDDPVGYKAKDLVAQMSELCGGKLCDGWKKGISGHLFSQHDGALAMGKS